MEDPVSLSYPSLPTETLAERFDLSPLCPANKRDNFSNLNRTPFESTGWNELEHHYGGVKQIYPHARRGITRFNPRWEKGEFFCLGKRNKDLAFYPLPPIRSSRIRVTVKQVWRGLRRFIIVDTNVSMREFRDLDLLFICSWLQFEEVEACIILIVFVWIFLFEEENVRNQWGIHGDNSKFLKITRNFNFKF